MSYIYIYIYRSFAKYAKNQYLDTLTVTSPRAESVNQNIFPLPPPILSLILPKYTQNSSNFTQQHAHDRVLLISALCVLVTHTTAHFPRTDTRCVCVLFLPLREQQREKARDGSETQNKMKTIRALGFAECKLLVAAGRSRWVESAKRGKTL